MLGNSRKFIPIVFAIALVTLSWGCGGSSTPANVISVAIFPTTPTVLVNGTVQFQAQVTGSTDRTVTWTLNDKPAGDTMSPVGKISADGLYTAPPTVPNPPITITVKATANADKKTSATATITLDSGIRVTVLPATATVGTGEKFQFSARVSNDPTNSVTWSVKETNAGTIDANGLYTAPAAVPSPATATIVATSKIDTARTGSATVTIVIAKTPTFSGISPKKAPQGGLFQDVYLNVTDLRSTSVVSLNGVPLNFDSDPETQLIVISNKLARLRLSADRLATAGTIKISIAGADQPPGDAAVLTVVPVRPAIVESFPDSIRQTPLNPDVTINGGYFGTPALPSVSAEFNGSMRTFSVLSPRQLKITLTSEDLNKPGLYSVAVRNKIVTTLAATTNVAVQPNPNPGPSLLSTLALAANAQDNPAPTAIAIDTAAGIAIVANTGNNTVQRISLDTLGLLGSQIPVGVAPSSVAVDERRHIALVVNSGDKTVSVVDLISGAVTTPYDLKAVFGQQATIPTPAAVGIEPNSGLALVVYQSTNAGTILNVDATKPQTCLFGTSPRCVIGAVTISTGAAPQIAVDPRLRWAFVTPGGGGPLSVVDLSQAGNSVDISDAPNGAKRVSNVVTVTTKTPHNLNPSIPTSVAVTGVADTSFNGTFSVTSVPTASTFTYNQTASNASSGGGKISFGRPLLTFAVGNTIRGIAINPISSKVLLADVNSNFQDIVSELDQTANSVDIGHPASAAAFNPFTNVGVLVKPDTVGAGGNTFTLIDPSKPEVLKNDINTGGLGSTAVAVDPGTNRAFIVNTTSSNVTVFNLGPSIKNVHISQIIIQDPLRQLIPNFTLASNVPLALTLNGNGFTGSPRVRLDGTEVAAVTSVSDRRLDVTIPASFLTGPRRYSLDVINGGVVSNSMDLTVVQAVPIPDSAGCAQPAPAAVAIDPERDIVVVANAGVGCNSVSLVDLNSGTVKSSIAVGTRPEGIAILSRSGRAVVTNNGSDNASIVDITDPAAPKIIENGNIATGKGPLGVAINQDTGVAVVANSQSSSISVFDAIAGGTVNTTGTSRIPLAVSIDPTRNVAAVASSQDGVFDIFNLTSTTASPSATLRGSVNVGGFGGNPLPTSVVFDAATGNFFGSGSLGNQIFVINPDTGQVQSARVGVNPTSLAYNFQSSTLVTINTVGKTISVVDSQTLRTTAVLGIAVSPVSCSTDQTLSQSCPPPSAVDIHPRSNLAVVADQAGNRILIVPLPR